MIRNHTDGAAFEQLSTREGYDRWAAIYDQELNPLVVLEGPLMSELLGETSGMHVLDVGCGTGRHAVRLAMEGASVTALDFSSEMLSRALRKPGAEAIRFLVHDLNEPLPFEPALFDRVICSLVFDHIGQPAALLTQMKRVCKRDGFIIVSVMHPAMMLLGTQARFTDPSSGRETRPESCSHQLADYVMAVNQAGLTIDRISEHVVDQALAERCPRAEKYLGWPMLLMIKLLHCRSYESELKATTLGPH